MAVHRTVRLGRSEMYVTAVGFGGIPIQRVTDTEAIRVIRRALDGGMNWIDTANAYGTSEERIGRAIAGYDRGSIFLFTKGQARRPDDLACQIELSLKRLATDYLDLYQFHLVPDADTWARMQDEGALELLRSYRRRGIVRHIGASAHTVEGAKAVLGTPDIEVLQYPFNFIVEAEGLEVLEACRRADVGFVAMKAFAGGVLGSAPACIRFLLQFPDVAADPGFEREGEVREVLALWRESAPLSAADLQTIERLKATLGTRFCRRCGYCSPCPEGVQIITLMTMDSLVRRFPLGELQGETAWIGQAARSAAACTRCGQCEERCPYKLPIVDGVQEGARIWREAVGAVD
jgi:predicted aldo/keto reductase-like oxidoreductase